MTVTVRQATPEDIDIVYELIIAIAAHHDEEHFVVTSKSELAQSGFGPSAKFGVLLAEVESEGKSGGKREIAGYVSYTWNYSIWLGANIMNIDDVFVWQAFRGQKVGEALMVKAREVCHANGCKRLKWEVEQDNHQAIKFYQRLGAEVNIKGVCVWT
jgi:GNAT superfamily N-acetyltransferase